MSGEWDEQQKISWEKDVEDWMGASVWRVGQTAEDMYWEKDVEDCMGASVWRVGRTAKDIFGEGCGGLYGG